MLTDIIFNVPEGTTKEMVEKKWGPTNNPVLEFCADDECPTDVMAQIETERIEGTLENRQVRRRDWSRV